MAIEAPFERDPGAAGRRLTPPHRAHRRLLRPCLRLVRRAAPHRQLMHVGAAAIIIRRFSAGRIMPKSLACWLALVALAGAGSSQGAEVQPWLAQIGVTSQLLAGL